MIINNNTFIDLNVFLKEIANKYLISNIGKINDDDISIKTDLSQATKFDILIERLIIDYFTKLGVCSFLGEENYPSNFTDKNNYLTIDPIDGTRNFINGVNKIAIMISYIFHEKVLFSVVFNPITNDFYHLFEDKLYKNFKLHEIKLPSNHFGYLGDNSKDKFSKYLNNYELLYKSRCIGYDLIQVLEGERTFMSIVNGKSWDIFPVIGILESLNFNKTFKDNLNFNENMSNCSYFYYAKI